MPNKATWGSKKFAFKGIFKCAGCGSEITAEEKFKLLKDGGFNRHVYYHCTRQVKYDCKEKFINEKDLIDKLISYIKKHSKEIEVTHELEVLASRHAEITRHSLSTRGIDIAEVDPMLNTRSLSSRKAPTKNRGT